MNGSMYLHALVSLYSKMRTVKQAKGFLIIGIIILTLDLAMIGLYLTYDGFAIEEQMLGTTDMVIRTGGRLQEPFLEEYGFPLSANVTSPGNTTFTGITEMQHFSVFYQVAFGKNLLDGTAQNSKPQYAVPGASYDILLNLTSWIDVTTVSSSDFYVLDDLQNLLINESTVQTRTLSKDLDLISYSQNNTLEVTYFMTTGGGAFSPGSTSINYTLMSFNVSVQDSVSLAIHSEWSYRFVTRNLPVSTYDGNETLGFFQAQKGVSDSGFNLSGQFKCFYLNREAFVYGLRMPFLETGLLIAGFLLMILYQKTKTTSMTQSPNSGTSQPSRVLLCGEA